MRLSEEAGGKVFLVPCDTEERARYVPEVDDETCRGAFVCVTPNGEVRTGAEAVLSLGAVVPSLGKWAVVAHLPGGMTAARLVYGLVARFRRSLCCG